MFGGCTRYANIHSTWNMHLGWICTLIEFLPGSDVALDMRREFFKGHGVHDTCTLHLHGVHMAGVGPLRTPDIACWWTWWTLFDAFFGYSGKGLPNNCLMV